MFPLPMATDEGAETTFDNKPSSGSFGAEATFGATSGMTAAVCKASGTTTSAPSSTVAKVSFNVNAMGTADNSFSNLEALAS
jgi:hypothetical protein